MTMRIRTASTPRNFTRIVLLGLSAAALSACGSPLSESLGYGKESPDEFAIVTKAPLVIPPDYSLRPPRPGAPSPRETSPESVAQASLLGTSSLLDQEASAGPSAGELALLSNAGALNADPAVRALIDNETRALKRKDEQFLSEVLFWQKPSEPNRIVDATNEAQRLRENEALGRPVTEGETPEFDDTEGGGLLDYFFD